VNTARFYAVHGVMDVYLLWTVSVCVCV